MAHLDGRPTMVLERVDRWTWRWLEHNMDGLRALCWQRAYPKNKHHHTK
jgi:hypothetical protein